MSIHSGARSTRAIGIDAQVELEEALVAPLPGDRLMLCSDGLTGMVDDDMIQATLADHERPQDAAETLVAMANAAGGVDNTTVVVLDLSDEAPAAGRDPVTGEASSGRTYADEIVIHGRRGSGLRSRAVAIAAAVVVAIAAVVIVIMVTGNG